METAPLLNGTEHRTGGTVGIVGGGVAGLQTARSLTKHGFQCTIFEAATEVGGVWRSNYLNFGLQVPKELYEFPDFENEKTEWGEYPTGPAVQAYIEEFADKFKVRSLVRLNTKVLEITSTATGWTFTTQKQGEASKQESFNYCVIATGLYSMAKKFIPQLPGKEIFEGQILHSGDFQKPIQVEGKHVVVVGGGKSAVDSAVEASKIEGATVTLVGGSPHWPTPRKILGFIPFEYVFLSRFGQALVIGLTGPLPESTSWRCCLSCWYTLGWLIMTAIFKVVELLFAAQFLNCCGETSPLFKTGVVADFYGYGQVLDYSLRDAVRAGKVDWKVGQRPTAYTKDGIMVGDKELKADVVIFGTGFQKDYEIFTQPTKEKLGVEEDGLYLYRHTIPLNVPKLAFVGSELATISNVSAYGLQAAWLAKYWTGKITRDPSEMQEEVDATKSWKRKWMPALPSRANYVLLHQIQYYDQLLIDMGLPPHRKGNPLSEFFCPYRSRDYDGVVDA